MLTRYCKDMAAREKKALLLISHFFSFFLFFRSAQSKVTIKLELFSDFPLYNMFIAIFLIGYFMRNF